MKDDRNLDLVTQTILCPTLIGRDIQCDALRQLMIQARKGQGQVALISGEAGIGKSRLVREAENLAAAQGFTVLLGHCFEADRLLPYGPLLDLLRSYSLHHSSTELSKVLAPYATDLIKLLPELASLWPDLQPPSPQEAEQEKSQLFQTLIRFLTDFSSPGLIVIEDLHWSDNNSLDFLLRFTYQVRHHPILLLLTHRTDEIQYTFKQFLVNLDRSRLVTELQLSRLQAAEIELMIRTIFAQDQPVRQEFVDKIIDLTDGNPFFVEETLKSLVTTGDIYYEQGHWTRKPINELHVPRSIQVAVAQRVAQLDSATQQLLRLAAVAGRRFDLALLQQITGHNEAKLLALIKHLLAAQLIVEETADDFVFRHALTQQAVYNDLLLRERRVLHRTLAEHGETFYAGQEAKAVDLARHFYLGEIWPKAVDYARVAAQRAVALYAPSAVVERLNWALVAADQITDYSLLAHYDMLRTRGQAYEQLGDFDQACNDYMAALQAAQQAEDSAAIWQSFLDLGFLWAQRDYIEAGNYFQQALITARTMQDAVLLGHTLKRLGNWHMNVDHPDEAVAHLAEARHIFTELQDKRGLAQTFDLLGIANYARSNAIEGSQYYKQAISLFREVGDISGELNSLLIYAPRHCVYINNVAVWPTTAVVDRLANGEAALALARKVGAKPAEVIGLIWLGHALGISGQYDQALLQVQAGLVLAEEIEHLHFIATAHMVLGCIYWDLLFLDQAQHHLELALTEARKSNSIIWLGCIIGFLASTLLQQHKLSEAEQTLQQAWRSDLPMRSQGQRQLWCAQAELMLAQRRPDEALAIIKRLITADPQTPTVGENAIPRLSQLQGKALLQLGHYEAAQATLIEAQRFAQESPSLRWRLYLTLGHGYHRQNRRDDADRAFAATREILAELAGRISDEHLRDRFVAQTEAQFPKPTKKQQAKQQFAGLTAKEREVAALIAQGNSNKEIAAVLIVSHRTIETHVSNILSKLYMRSRAEIAVWANERGLTANTFDKR